MTTPTDIFHRTERLVGSQQMERLTQTKIIIFGVGGVGSWCAECLIRSGIGSLTMVDPDRVCSSNINRQLQATTKTIGRLKVDVLRERLAEINPQAEIVVRPEMFREETADSFALADYDYIIDCIDSLKDKALLLHFASQTPATVLSSMGAALKMDPTRIRVAEFWKVNGCPLAAALRKKLRRQDMPLQKKIMCVYSDELLSNQGPSIDDTTNSPIRKAQINGTMAHITAIFGFMLAGIALQSLTSR